LSPVAASKRALATPLHPRPSPHSILGKSASRVATAPVARDARARFSWSVAFPTHGRRDAEFPCPHAPTRGFGYTFEPRRSAAA
jgi:hypothetical protein